MVRHFVSLARAFAIAALAVSLINCSGGGGSSYTPPPPGTLSGTITDASLNPTLPIGGAVVTVFDTNTNSAVGILTSDAGGHYQMDLPAGSYYVKVAKQGFDPVPPLALEPVPFAILSGQTTANDIGMYPVANANIGWISGNVTLGGGGAVGVLVVATSGTTAFSALSDANGNYTINNVPVAADYSVTAYAAGLSANTVSPVVVSQGAATAGVNISLAADARGQVAVSFNVISQTGVTPPANMLVALIHPVTRETIPGLVQSLPYSSSINFTLSGVADGAYLVRATYANDTIVVDPDAIVKFGEPTVTLASGVPTPNPVDIKATSAVKLISPTNEMSITAPFIVSAAPAPTFSWDPYPSTSDYVVEVMDAITGTVVWGGFTKTATGTIKNVTTTSTSIVYGGPALIAGHVYRWRVYASKDDNQAADGWRLISVSEDQQGLIRIQ